jgi:hypothetical protein
MMKLLAFLLIPCALFANNDRVIFHHIPKTGGTTVNSILNNHFTKKEVFPKHFQFQLKKRPFVKPVQYRLVSGHFLFSTFKNLPGKRITFLREPVERVLSTQRFYEDFHKKSSLMNRQHIFPPGDPIKMLCNHQCKYFSSLNIYDENISDKEHLESAKYTLEHNFFFVGITEDLDNGVPLLCTLLGFSPPSKVPRYNTTKKPEEGYPEFLIQEIRERNWADIELYRFVKNLYEKKYLNKTKIP